MLRQIPKFSDPDLLVGVDTGDDAAVFRLSEDLALIQTVDFFPPIVDEPFVFGEIAVANALSDVYAMGGRPLLGLNIVGFPVSVPKEVLVDVLKGGASKAKEAGVLIVGGHTVDDAEPKYGLAVTGVVKPGSEVTNAGAQPGDVLVLTKPIGTGIITTAGKNGTVTSYVLNGAINTMQALNSKASAAMVRVGVNACVDITGFGLIGHLLVMLRASDATAKISLGSVPVLDGAWELVDQNVVPGGTRRNVKSAESALIWDDAISSQARLLLCDAQTSGGLLISVAPEKRESLLAELDAASIPTVAVIGEVGKSGSLDAGIIEVMP